MRPFTYHPAGSVAEAVELLGRYRDDDTQLLAGGTSVMLLGRLGLAAPDHVVGLRGIGELRGITVDAAGWLRVGALTTLREVETAPVVRGVPGLADAVHQVATVRIRNQATVGGNLAHADPAQDAPPMLIALGAEVEAAGPSGTRRLPVEELYTGYLETSLGPAEVITAVAVPPQPPQARGAYLKFLPRTQDDYATVSVAAVAETADGRVTRLRLALGAAAPTPVRATGVETALGRATLDSGVVEEAAASVRDDIDPTSDARGSAAYKQDMAVVCVRRLLERLLRPEEETW